MGDLVAVVPVAVRRAGGSKSIETRAHGAVADGVDVHRETGGVELRDQPGKMLRVEIKLAGMLGRFAVGVEIGREQRRRLRRIFHHTVGEDLDQAGAEKIRIDVAALLAATRRATASSLSSFGSAT